MRGKGDHVTDFRPYCCTALKLQDGWFSASGAARLIGSLNLGTGFSRYRSLANDHQSRTRNRGRGSQQAEPAAT
jgi:hypothetical protein